MDFGNACLFNKKPEDMRRVGALGGRARARNLPSRGGAADLVSSSTVAESASAIIGPNGKLLAQTTDDFGVAISEIDLNREYRLLWLSVGAEGEAKSLYIKERQPHTYGVLTDASRRPK